MVLPWGLSRGALVEGEFSFLPFRNLFDIVLPLSLRRGLTEVTQTDVPKFDGSTGSFANYGEKGLSWKRASAMEPEKQAAHLLLHMSDVARKVCLNVVRDVIDNLDGAEQILRILREYFAPDAIDSISQEIVKSMFFERTEQTMDTYIMEFGMLRGEAGSRLLLGPGFPDAFVAALRMRNAALSENEKTMA